MKKLTLLGFCAFCAFMAMGCKSSDSAQNHLQSVEGGLSASPSSDQFSPQVQPSVQGDLWRLTFGSIVVEIDAAVGGSITTFSRSGVNILAAGSWLRPSPQLAWNWPPPPEVENMPYKAWTNGNVITMQGQVNAQWGLQATKRFWANAAHDVFTVEYTLRNVGKKATKWAPWEISRVHPTGLTFFPEGRAISAKAAATQLPLKSIDGIAWFDYYPAALTPGKYIVARDGAEGWIAHVESGLIFIKTFVDITPDQIAPDEGELQLYTEAPATAGGFLEVENEGPYVMLQPGESTTWIVRWYLRDLPANLTAKAGSAELVQFVRNEIEK